MGMAASAPAGGQLQTPGTVPPGLMHLTEEQVNQMFAEGATFSVPRPPPPMVHNARSVRNDVNLLRDSLKIVGSDADTRFHVEFTLDTAKPCAVTLYLMATEGVNHGNITTQLKSKQIASRKVMGSGLGQRFVSDHTFDISRMRSISYDTNTAAVYPLVILLEATDTSDSNTTAATSFSGSAAVQSQTTYVSLKHGTSGLEGEVLKQKLQVEGQAFEMQSIYGLGDSSDGDDCVVCLSDARSTTVLPCRHLCVCYDCAQQLRTQTNKCPICRANVESLLHIDLAAKSAAISSAEGTGDDSGAGIGAGAGSGSGVEV